MSTGWKLLMALVLLAALVGGAGMAGYQRGSADKNAEWTADKLRLEREGREADRENRRIEQARQNRVLEANHAAIQREVLLRAAADGARGERDRLHDDLSAARAELPRASCEAVRQRAAALSDVFDQCAGALEGLAAKAGRHASDALKFEQAWPVDEVARKGADHGKED